MPGTLTDPRLRRGLIAALLAAFALAFAAGSLHHAARPGDPSSARRPTLTAREGTVPAFDALAPAPAIPNLRAAPRRPAGAAATSRTVSDALPSATPTATPVPGAPAVDPAPAPPPVARPEPPAGETFDSSG